MNRCKGYICVCVYVCMLLVCTRYVYTHRSIDISQLHVTTFRIMTVDTFKYPLVINK